jgi:hypothetical protein
MNQIVIPYHALADLREHGKDLRIAAIQYREAGHVMAARALEQASAVLIDNLTNLR